MTSAEIHLRAWADESIRPVIRDILRDELADILPKLKLNITGTPEQPEPYGDFNWLVTTCSGVPASTLRIKSAAGEIPGVVKFGKRVLYEKALVLNWLGSQARQPVPSAADITLAAEEQVRRQLAKKGGPDHE